MENLSNQDKVDIAKEVVKAITESEDYRHAHCRFISIDPEIHAKQHEDIGEVIEFFKNVNRIKWDIPKTVVKILVWFAIAAVLKFWGLEWLLNKSGG